MSHRVVLIPGDGIGPEVTEAVTRILAAAGADIDWVHRQAVFEAVHGTAPDIAGKDLANPLALLMSAVMMLNYLAARRNDATAKQAADRIRDAYNACLLAGEKTHDLGGNLGTIEFAEAVIARLDA